MISGPAGCDHFRNKVALLALLFKHNNCGFSESKDSKQEIRSLHQKITGMHLVWTVEMSISCSWASQFLSSFIRRNYKLCLKSSCQQSHYLLFGFALSFMCLKLTPKISQRIISQRTSVVLISFCQTAVPWPRGTSERRGPGRERLFKLERLGDGKIQRAYRVKRKRHEDMKGQNSDLRVCPHLLDCVCQKREEDSGRNKTINMNSTLGNVRFLDNSRHSQTNGPFHNHSKQTETLLATSH